MKKIALFFLIIVFLFSLAVAGAASLVMMASQTLIKKIGFEPPKVKKVQEIFDE